MATEDTVPRAMTVLKEGSGSWAVWLTGPLWPPPGKIEQKGRVGGTFACPVAFLGWQNSILIPFCPVSWESLEEQGGPDTSREQSCPMVSREERKIGDARWVVDGRDRAEGQGGEVLWELA